MLPPKALSVLIIIALACLQWGCAGAPKFTYSMKRPRVIETLAVTSGSSQDEKVDLYLTHRAMRRKKTAYVGWQAVSRISLVNYLEDDQAANPDPERDAEYLAILGSKGASSVPESAWPAVAASDLALQAFNRSLQRRLGLSLSDPGAKPAYPDPAYTFSYYRSTGLKAPRIREYKAGWQIGDLIYSRDEFYGYLRQVGQPELADELSRASRYKSLSQFGTITGAVVLVPTVVGGIVYGILYLFVWLISPYGASGNFAHTDRLLTWGGVVVGSGIITGFSAYGWASNWATEKRAIKKITKLSTAGPDGRSSLEPSHLDVKLLLEPLPSGMNLRLATRF